MWSREVTWKVNNIMTPQWGGLVRSPDKLNTLYLDLQKTHEHQTRQNGNLLAEILTYKDTLALWLRGQQEITWQFKIVVSLSQDLWPLTMAGCWFRREVSARKRLSRHKILVGFACSTKIFAIANVFSPSLQCFWADQQKLFFMFYICFIYCCSKRVWPVLSFTFYVLS